MILVCYEKHNNVAFLIKNKPFYIANSTGLGPWIGNNSDSALL